MVASGILYTNSWSDRYVKPAFGIFFLVSFVYISITPLSAKISAAALRALEMGGGVKKFYYVNNEDAKEIIPDEFLNDKCCIDDFCFTNKLSIIWSVGDLVYVGVPSKRNPPIKQHIAIPRNILMPYKLDEPLPDVCKTEKELKEVVEKVQKE